MISGSSRARSRLWAGVCAVAAAVLGVLPHVLHHAGPLAGAALFAGVGGSLLFGALGFVAAIPFLLGLRRRSGGWRLPAAALALFASVFAVSTFVVGPQVGSDDESSESTESPPAPAESAHDAHH